MKLGFYDVGTKKRFETDVYQIKKKEGKRGMRWFAVTSSANGDYFCHRILTEAFAKKLLDMGTPMMT